jgi:hypothetical protein
MDELILRTGFEWTFWLLRNFYAVSTWAHIELKCVSPACLLQDCSNMDCSPHTHRAGRRTLCPSIVERDCGRAGPWSLHNAIASNVSNVRVGVGSPCLRHTSVVHSPHNTLPSSGLWHEYLISAACYRTSTSIAPSCVSLEIVVRGDSFIYPPRMILTKQTGRPNPLCYVSDKRVITAKPVPKHQFEKWLQTARESPFYELWRKSSIQMCL